MYTNRPQGVNYGYLHVLKYLLFIIIIYINFQADEFIQQDIIIILKEKGVMQTMDL